MTTVEKCCYCEKKINGEVSYRIPEGFPNNPRHEGRALCDDCGCGPEPTLEAICEKLDALWAARRQVWNRVIFASLTLLSAASLGELFGKWVFVVALLSGVAAGRFASRWLS